jgi:integrase/recombinase XerD
MREGQARVLNEKEFNRALNVVYTKAHSKRNAAILYFSFGLGLRAKELASLKISHIMGLDGDLLDEINLKSNMTKGYKQRYAYLTNNKVRKFIQEFIDERKLKDGMLFSIDAPLFRSQKGSHFTPNTMQQLLHRVFTQAGLIGASSHSGRRTFATNLIEKGVDIKAVSTLMGHTTINMTAKYIQNNPIRLKLISSNSLDFL